MLRLRKLAIKDAPKMLEWMHDSKVNCRFIKDFCKYTLTDCILFLNSAQDMTTNLHMAIVNQWDEYLGTVSLKNINYTNAEFAIVLRHEAMGCGVGKYAMEEIMRIGFVNCNLKIIYWNVRKDNIRAIKFYEKMGYYPISWERLKGIFSSISAPPPRRYIFFSIVLVYIKKII